MNLLLISATKHEADIIIKDLGMKQIKPSLYSSSTHKTDLLLTGIGIPATLFSMFTDVDIRKYDLLINIGVAGSFNKNAKIGDILNVSSDSFGDIGINSKNGFLSVFKTEFNDKFKNLINNGQILNTSDFPAFFHALPKCKGVSVNLPEAMLYPQTDVETMEGAAFMLVCKHYKKVFIQIRGISNIIGYTQRKDWDMNTPIKNYSEYIIEFIEKNKQ
ncbi:MAG: hypothetical protein PHZ24_04985 [Bacteroidales bacterium]|nr:hypothetical protein [Bacteroidales bacterium]MDY0141624.1 hypothetical protein [Bacteroidales bacterium]